MQVDLVDSIVDSRTTKNKMYLLVHWSGFDEPGEQLGIAGQPSPPFTLYTILP
jgi:hypothetical protein